MCSQVLCLAAVLFLHGFVWTIVNLFKGRLPQVGSMCGRQLWRHARGAAPPLPPSGGSMQVSGELGPGGKSNCAAIEFRI